MKASQVIARIEAAGWKKIRSEGSHAVFEHPKYGRRSTAFGRPQRDVNKHRLLEVVRDFHLDEIENAKIEARLAEAKRRPEPQRVTLARVVPEPVAEMTTQDARLLWTQLHRDHNEVIVRITEKTGIGYGPLRDFFYHGQDLSPDAWQILKSYLTESERKFKLTRNLSELRKKGYGVRTGTSNEADPFLGILREALQTTFDKGVRIVDLAQTLGMTAAVLQGIKSGRSKTIYPRNREILARWYAENWADSRSTTTVTPDPIPDIEVLPLKVVPVEDRLSDDPQIDDELVAIQIVLKAIKPLNREAARRALSYVLERMG